AGSPKAVAPAPLETTHIGYPSYSIGYLPLLVADAQGYYQEQGLSAELFGTDLDTARQSLELFLPAISADGTVERSGVETVVDAEREAGTTLPPLTFEQLVDPSLAVEPQLDLGLPH